MIDGLQVGGAERSLLFLCQHLREFIPVVLVLSDSIALKPEFEKSGIQVIVKPFPRNYRFGKHAKILKPIIDSINPAIIHSSLFHADMMLRYLDTPAKKVSGLVSTMYSIGRLKQLPLLTRKKLQVLKFWDRFTLTKIDLFIANSNSIRKFYLNHVGYSAEKVKVIFRGRTIPSFDSYLQRKKSEFLFVGRLIRSKGLQEAIIAFGKLTQEKPELIFNIAGKGPELDNLESLVRTLDLEGKVNFLGQVDRVFDILRESSFFIFPSHYEGLPGSLIEAMMAKIPIICSDIPENKECVDESMCLFHRVGDSTDILTQMKKALALKDWEERTERAFNFAIEHFEIGRVVQQYEETYEHLLKRK